MVEISIIKIVFEFIDEMRYKKGFDKFRNLKRIL